MFKISLISNVQNLDGSDANFQGVPLSMREVITRALTAVYEGDQTSSLETRMYRMRLASEAATNDKTTLSLTDLLVIVPLVIRAFAHPLVIASFLKAIEDSLKSNTTFSSIAASTISTQE